MGRTIRRGILRHVVQASGAESSYGAIGHGLAAGDGAFIFEIE